MWLLAATSRLALCAAFSLRSLRSANQLQGRMVETLFIVGDVAVTVGQALIPLLVVAVKLGGAARERRSEAAAEAVRSEQIEQRVASLARIQAETVGRLHSMGETFSGRQAELGRVVNERLDAVTHRLGQSMEATTRHTVESLRHLHERLAVIDNAQKNL